MLLCVANVYRDEYQLLLNRLHAARKASGLTQVEVARRLGRTQGYVNKLETGERRMDVVQLMDFCAAIESEFVLFIHDYYEALAATKESK